MKSLRPRHPERRVGRPHQSLYAPELPPIFAAAKRDRARLARVKVAYGLDAQTYLKMVDKLGREGCPICGKMVDVSNPKGFAVDHDHACCSGKVTCGKCVRGLLCSGCNTGLGAFRDSEHALTVGAKYVAYHAAKRAR